MTTSTHIPNRYRVTSVTLPQSLSPSVVRSPSLRASVPLPLRGSALRGPSLRAPSSVVRLRLSIFLHFSILLLMLRPSNALATASELLLVSCSHDFSHFFTTHLFSSTPHPKVTNVTK